jgi:protein-S-isoprenylcysteine O-methyltransferase Ste14
VKKYLSIVLPISLIAAICTIALVNAWDGGADWSAWTPLPRTALCVVYVLWMLFELRTARPEPEARYADYGTREFYGAGHAATILSALMCARADGPGAGVLAAGASVFAAGVGLRIWAVLTLGAFYSHAVRTLSGHRVVDTGPYRVIRHPAYAGMLLAHAGVVAFFFNYITLAAYLCWLLPAIVVRILVEERALTGIDGYAEFARTRKRIIPGVW